METALVNAWVVLPDQSRFYGAIGIQEGRIARIGSVEAVRAVCGPETEVHDLGGACVLPGFIDSHMHLAMAAEYFSSIGLRDARSMAQVLERVAAFAASHPERTWLLGLEWSYGYPDLPDTGFDRALLDSIVPDRPVFLRSGMAHAAWANSAALAAAGIDAATPDPEGGEIVRRADGTPSGWLKEQAARLVEAVIPPTAEAQRREGLAAALREAARCGVTRMQSAAFDESLLPLLATMRAENALTCRIGMMIEMPPPAFSAARLAEIDALRARYDDDWLRVDGVKFFLDGVLESHTAFMPGGYADRPAETGTLVWAPEAYRQAVGSALRAGYPIWTHAIGSGAIRLALDAYAAEPDATRALRPRVEHVEIPDAGDISRFAALGAVASLQPVMIAPSDEWMGMGGVWALRVRPEDQPRAFPLRALLDAGAAVVFGTDWPIVSLAPLRGIRKAVTRRSLEGGAPFVPGERITVREAVRAYTEAGGWANHREATEGRIAPGMAADLVVLETDPERVDPEALDQIGVLMTMVAGRIVHRQN